MLHSGVLTAVLPGADDTGLGPLVHLEETVGIAPDPIRRLAVLGGEALKDRLRLSNAETKRLDMIRDGVGDMARPAALGYHHGAALALDIILLRAVMLDTPPDPGFEGAVERGASAVFPVKAADLMPRLNGPVLGRKLAELEAAWIASGFRLSRTELLERAR